MKNIIIEKTDKIISGHLKIPPKDLSDDITSDELSEWDSVTHLKIISELEKNFGIKFSIDEITELENVGKIRKLVLKKVGEKNEL
ncbi:acyl carrier protein [Candidatus Pacearchaeota archaeon]|nr:acyl carrier protein [Candidatus Pacearchaeota archaeon]